MGSSFGENLSSIHGDLIVEICNGKTKGTAGPLRSGSSTNTTAMNLG